MAESPQLKVVRGDGDPLRIRLIGELDRSTGPLLQDALEEIENGRVILDLSELTFIDSTGLHVIARFMGSGNGSRAVILANMTPEVARVFDIVGLGEDPRLVRERDAG